MSSCSVGGVEMDLRTVVWLLKGKDGGREEGPDV